ncbi:MAG: TIR domain-containing protein [Desulfobulbaceae bacterium]|nr:TIR domain-containing protein [Desulfobulbaceae bacterium]
MARKIFFSFHYKRDAWRAGQVRNSNLIPNEDEYGVIDGVEWEKIERQGDEAIKRWIKSQLEYTSVTVVLIGAETASREWVRYEIMESWNRGNAIIGVRIHNLKDQDQQADSEGANPLEEIKFSDGTPLSAYCKTYDWISGDGRNNLGKWAEEAVQAMEAQSKRGTLPKLQQSVQNTKNEATATAIRPIVIKNPPGQWAS